MIATRNLINARRAHPRMTTAEELDLTNATDCCGATKPKNPGLARGVWIPPPSKRPHHGDPRGSISQPRTTESSTGEVPIEK